MAESLADIIMAEDLDKSLELLLDDSAWNLAATYRDEITDVNKDVLTGASELALKFEQSSNFSKAQKLVSIVRRGGWFISLGNFK